MTALGAEVRWASCNIFSTQDHAAAAVVKARTANVFAWKGETLAEYWDLTNRMLTWPQGDGPDILVDDGGDATLIIHEGVKAEHHFAKTQELPDPDKYDNAEFKHVIRIIRQGLQDGQTEKWTKIANRLVGVSEETTTGVSKAKKSKYCKMSIGDESGSIKVLIFNDKMEESKSLNEGLPKEKNIVIITGKKMEDVVFADMFAIQDNQVYTKLSDLKKEKAE